MKAFRSIKKMFTELVQKKERKRENIMGLYVNTNINSMIAQRSLTTATSGMQSAIKRLSTGLRVNQAGDDAAGLCVAQGLETQIRGNKRAMLNIQDGLNMMYIAEGGMSGVTEDLQRIRELCIQAANGVYSEAQQQTLINEIDERIKDIDVIANTTTFNGLNIGNGTIQKKVELQTGSGSDGTNNSIEITQALTDMNTSALGIGIEIASQPGFYCSGLSGTSTGDEIRAYMEKLELAINKISEDRSKLGAYQNRLQSASDNLSVMNENYSQAKSQIMDTDMAEESANMVKYQVLQQTSAAMLAQANQIPSIAMQLLQPYQYP